MSYLIRFIFPLLFTISVLTFRQGTTDSHEDSYSGDSNQPGSLNFMLYTPPLKQFVGIFI